MCYRGGKLLAVLSAFETMLEENVRKGHEVFSKNGWFGINEWASMME